MVGRPYPLAPLVLVLILLSPACAELEMLKEGSGGGAGPPPSGSLSVSFIDVGQGDGVLVQAGGESYLIDAGRPEEGPNVVDFLRSRGVDELEGIVVSNPDADHIGGLLDVFDAFPLGTLDSALEGLEVGDTVDEALLGRLGEVRTALEDVLERTEGAVEDTTASP